MNHILRRFDNTGLVFVLSYCTRWIYHQCQYLNC